MSGKIYSHIDKIPSGSASRKVTEGCLVLEGGAFRGLYSQGFMDAMMKAIQDAGYSSDPRDRGIYLCSGSIVRGSAGRILQGDPWKETV